MVVQRKGGGLGNNQIVAIGEGFRNFGRGVCRRQATKSVQFCEFCFKVAFWRLGAGRMVILGGLGHVRLHKGLSGAGAVLGNIAENIPPLKKFSGELGPGQRVFRLRVCQVKEKKMGGLRFYTMGPCPDEVERLIDVASEESVRTCEVCGQPGSWKAMDGRANAG
jgi:hypothetical protein